MGADKENSIREEKRSPLFIWASTYGNHLLEAHWAGIQNCRVGELTTFVIVQFQLDKKMAYPFDQSLPDGIGKLDFKVLGDRYLEKTLWRAGGKAFSIDKHPANLNFAGLIAKALPNAKIINLVRHPMDACFSNLKEVFAPSLQLQLQQEEAPSLQNYRRLRHWHQLRQKNYRCCL